MNNILVIDDEKQIQKLLDIALEGAGYRTESAYTGKEGLIKAAHHPPDLILLDIGLPDLSGHEVLKRLREWYLKPILILSVLNDEENIVNALDHGANDYLSKPFRNGELIARIRSAIRLTESTAPAPVFQGKNIVVDFSSRTVKKHDIPVKLTSTEYNLLCLFIKNEGRVLTHQYVLKQIWGPSFIHQTQYLRVFIAQLRKKLEDNPNVPLYIVTESGIGYRFISGI